MQSVAQGGRWRGDEEKGRQGDKMFSKTTKVEGRDAETAPASMADPAGSAQA